MAEKKKKLYFSIETQHVIFKRKKTKHLINYNLILTHLTPCVPHGHRIVVTGVCPTAGWVRPH